MFSSILNRRKCRITFVKWETTKTFNERVVWKFDWNKSRLMCRTSSKCDASIIFTDQSIKFRGDKTNPMQFRLQLPLFRELSVNIFYTFLKIHQKLTWNFSRSSSAILLNSLKVTVASLRQGGGMEGGDCPSTLGVESGGNRDPYSIDTHPRSSVPCRVLT